MTWLIWRKARTAAGTPRPYAGEPVAAPADRRFERDTARDAEREPTV